jgi:fructosamine-3-kinase
MEQVARLLRSDVVSVKAIAGGDLSEVFEAELADGRFVIVKTGTLAQAEAEMLAAIGATGAATPAVLAHDDSVLVLERRPAGGRLEDAWPDLGATLARLHSSRAGDATTGEFQGYGWYRDYAFGEVAIENLSLADWPSFWAERRLMNQLSNIEADLGTRVERLAEQLAERLPARPSPALLHGDLWSGNILISEGRVTGLIDPACYYGHSEVDFAMLGLFSALDPRLYEHYGPLADGSAERRPIYQLWPALVHLRLFGRSYRPMVERLLGASGV